MATDLKKEFSNIRDRRFSDHVAIEMPNIKKDDEIISEEIEKQFKTLKDIDYKITLLNNKYRKIHTDVLNDNKDKKNEATKLSNEIKISIDGVVNKCSILLRQINSIKSDNKTILKNKLVSCATQTQEITKRFMSISEKHIEPDAKLSTPNESMSSQLLTTAEFDSLYYQEDATYKLEEAKRIAEQVKEINSMFTQLALIINTQGTMLDTIENNIDSAEKDTSKGYDNLVKSEKTQKCCNWTVYIIIGIIILLVILAVILATTI